MRVSDFGPPTGTHWLNRDSFLRAQAADLLCVLGGSRIEIKRHVSLSRIRIPYPYPVSVLYKEACGSNPYPVSRIPYKYKEACGSNPYPV